MRVRTQSLAHCEGLYCPLSTVWLSARQPPETGATLNYMAKGVKEGAIPDWLKEAVADNLKRFMVKSGLNSVQLAAKAGLKYPKQVERLRRRETNPTLTTLCRLADPLDVQVWEFLIPQQPKIKGPMLRGQDRRPTEIQAVAAEIPSKVKKSQLKKT